MKILKILLVLALLISASSIFAEDKKQDANKKELNGLTKTTLANKKKESNGEKIQTLFNSKELKFSGYGAPSLRFSKFGNSYGLLTGGRGGLIINDHFVIGGGGFGLVNNRSRNAITGQSYSGEYPYVDFGYGGAIMEFYFFPKKLIHLSAGILIGAGGLSFSSSRYNLKDNNNFDSGNTFFVAEPELNIFINIVKFFRLGIGASYRYINGINRENFSDQQMSGFSGSIMLSFGWF